MGEPIQTALEHWVRDDEKTRRCDGQTVLIKGRGVFLMRVRETNSKGERNPGYVQLLIEPQKSTITKDSPQKKWKIEYNNDTGPTDDCFWEWWVVTDGDKAFKCSDEADAQWLCNWLNLST